MTAEKHWLETLGSRLASSGLNHVGVTSARAWDAVASPETCTEAVAPGARSVVVVASAGPSFWRAFVAHCRVHPDHFLASAHPLDAFARRAIEMATVGEPHPWHFAAFDAALALDFRTLAVQAGLGAPSRLGLVLHPRWGPWIGLRAAGFVPFALPETGASPDLCTGCPAPCETACPGAAFEAGQWSVSRCASFHQVSDTCARSCASREACPVGLEHRYPSLARLYHYNRAEGRAALREALSIPPSQDPHTGSSPYWDSWSLP